MARFAVGPADAGETESFEGALPVVERVRGTPLGYCGGPALDSYGTLAPGQRDRRRMRAWVTPLPGRSWGNGE